MKEIREKIQNLSRFQVMHVAAASVQAAHDVRRIVQGVPQIQYTSNEHDVQVHIWHIYM